MNDDTERGVTPESAAFVVDGDPPPATRRAQCDAARRTYAKFSFDDVVAAASAATTAAIAADVVARRAVDACPNVVKIAVLTAIRERLETYDGTETHETIVVPEAGIPFAMASLRRMKYAIVDAPCAYDYDPPLFMIRFVIPW